MKRRFSIVSLILLLIAIGFEIYPKSAVISRIAAPTEHFVDYYSYFSLTPFWSENTYPLKTAILSCIAFILILVKVLKRVENKAFNISLLGAELLLLLYSWLSTCTQYDNKIAIVIFSFIVFCSCTTIAGMLVKDNKG